MGWIGIGVLAGVVAALLLSPTLRSLFVLLIIGLLAAGAVVVLIATAAVPRL